MNAVTAKFSGWDELQKKLEQLPRNVARNGLRKALRAGANVVQQAFVDHAPEETGFLKEHFGQRTRMRSNELAGSVFVGPDGKTDYPNRDGGYRQKLRAALGKAANIGRISVAAVARYLEFGTTKMAKKPFMTQAWESSKSAALDAIVAKLRSVLSQETK